MARPVQINADVMPAKAGTHATIRTMDEGGVDPRLRGDDAVSCVGGYRLQSGARA